MPTSNDLIGTWRITAVSEWGGDGAERHPIGDAPVGYAVFDAAAGIFVQLGRNPADGGAPKEIAASFMAYFGTFSLAGDQLTIVTETGNAAHDVAATLTRTISLAGDTLTIGTPGRFAATLQRVTAAAVAKPLTGAWRVQSFTRFGKDGAPNDPLGRPPAGFAVFDTTGRAFVQLGKAASAGPAEDVAKSLMAYFGPCSIDGDTLSVVLEASNMPAYIGSTQTRKFTRAGDVLRLGTPGEYQAVLQRVR